jgi:hypothetical protein
VVLALRGDPAGEMESGIFDMLAHAIVPAFAFNGSANYQGTWTFTF